LLVRFSVAPDALAVTKAPESPLNLLARLLAIVVGVSLCPLSRFIPYLDHQEALRWISSRIASANG
jgi:hypothetical protein